MKLKLQEKPFHPIKFEITLETEKEKETFKAVVSAGTTAVTECVNKSNGNNNADFEAWANMSAELFHFLENN